jgi:predicted heme/steroid binding protein
VGPVGPGSRPVPDRGFTDAELRRHDGDRGPAYVAYGGLVYDVSGSPEWRSGHHRSLHWAGQDLTGELAEAPHGPENVERFPIVGRYLGPVE